MSKKKSTSKKSQAYASTALAALDDSGAVSIGAPVNGAGVYNDVEMGLLKDAHGDANVPDAVTDTLRDGQVIVYNNMNSGTLNDDLTAAEIASLGFPVNADLDGATPGRYTWQTGDASALGEDAPGPAADNNRLWVLARWNRDIGGGEIVPHDPPATANVKYMGRNVPPPMTPLAKPASGSKSKLKSSSELAGIKARRNGSWLTYRKVSASSPLTGFKLLDPTGAPLHATRILVYAFDVEWNYTDLSERPPRIPHHVRRSIGDTLECEPGPSFLSPHNSLIIWQGNWNTRRRLVILGNSPKTADVAELDPTKDIFIHVNHHRVKPLVVKGTFSIRVRVLKS